jgi:glycerophosphoryl diester phosphodiesterase
MKIDYTGPMRIAHRGVMQLAPDNTIGAYEAAFQAGYEGLEIDVRLSRDGEVVVVHDANLTRVTLGHPSKASNALIADLDWEALSQVEMPYANHLLPAELPPHSEIEDLLYVPWRILGQHCPYKEALKKDPRMAKLMRLQDFRDWLEKKPNMIAEIEICTGGEAKKIFDILDGSPAVERCIVFSGHREYLDEMQSVAAKEGKPRGLKLGANIRALNEDAKKIIASMDLYEIGLNDGHISREDLAWLKDRGIQVFSNLGDYPAWWSKIREFNIAGFKTNYAEAYTRWWKETI